MGGLLKATTKSLAALIIASTAMCSSAFAQSVSNPPVFDTATMAIADYAAAYSDLQLWVNTSNADVLAAEQTCLADTTQTADACTAVKKADLTFIAAGYKSTDKVLEKGVNSLLRTAKMQAYTDIKSCITNSPSTVLDPVTGRVTSYDKTEIATCFATAKTTLNSLRTDLEVVRVAEKSAEQELNVVQQELRELMPAPTRTNERRRSSHRH